MNKQEIQNNIKNAVIDTDIQDIYIVGLELPIFADEPENVIISIKINDLDAWIIESGLLQNEVDYFNPVDGHFQRTEFTAIEDFDITDDVIKEYIRTNDKFSIL